MLYVPLYFEIKLTVDALVDSRALFSAIVQNEMDTIKEKAPNIILKIDDTPIFQIQVANGQLEKPLATATPKFEIRDKIFAEHFVVMRINSVANDTTHGLIQFPQLTLPVKTASSETATNASQSSPTMP